MEDLTMKHQLMKAPDGLWCVFIHAPFAEDLAERSLEAEPVLYIEVEEYVDPEDLDDDGRPFEDVFYNPVILYSSQIGLSTPAGLMSRLYWATSPEDALAQHAADADNLIAELTHDHSGGDLPDAPRPARPRPRLVH
jgi:hypothetical protein